MPELPEVETIVRGLRPLHGRRFKRVRLSPSKRLDSAMGRRLQGKRIQTIDRRGKLLIFRLQGDNHLLIHLKMTGQLVYKPKANKLFVGGHPIVNVTEVPNKFTLAEFHFDDTSALYFNDVRKFGYIKLVSTQETEELLRGYGPEPLSRGIPSQMEQGVTF